MSLVKSFNSDSLNASPATKPAHTQQSTWASDPALPLPADPNEALRMHGSWLRAVAIARLRGLEGADDVMQDVAMAAVRNWETLRTAANAKPWLYRLTVRAALMHRRTLGRARKRIKEAIDTYTAKHGASEAGGGYRQSGGGGLGGGEAGLEAGASGALGANPLGALL